MQTTTAIEATKIIPRSRAQIYNLIRAGKLRMLDGGIPLDDVMTLRQEIAEAHVEELKAMGFEVVTFDRRAA